MIRQISCSDVFRDANALAFMSEYAAECSIPQIGEINPQPQTYEAMEKTGMLKCFGAYEQGRLVGFATVITTPLPHYSRVVATVESLFVAKDQRPGGIGRELMTAMEAYAKEAGCTAILYSAPTGSKLEQVLGLSKSYKRTNAVFCRKLR